MAWCSVTLDWKSSKDLAIIWSSYWIQLQIFHLCKTIGKLTFKGMNCIKISSISKFYHRNMFISLEKNTLGNKKIEVPA